MKIKGINAFELLSSNHSFSIPLYQREYSWKESECIPLIDSIYNQMKNHEPLHFMGSICYQKKDNNIICIDGQQRITSLMLFLIALRNLSVDKSFQEYIDDNFIYYNNEVKMNLKDKDMEVLLKIIGLKEGIFAKRRLTEEDTKNNIYINYNIICKEIYKIVGEDFYEFQYKWIEVLKTLEFASIQLEKENPQLVFESLNSTGLNLSEIDKIRNYILMPLSLETQKEVYSKYWRFLEDSLSDKFQDFLVSYLIIKNKSECIQKDMGISVNNVINEKSLYDSFKYLCNGDSITFLKDVRCVAELYLSFIKRDNRKDEDKNNENLYNLNLKERILYIVFHVIQIDSALTLYLYLLMKEKELDQDLTEAFELYFSYIIRCKVCERQSINNSHASYLIHNTYLYKEKGGVLEGFKKLLMFSDGIYKFPTNEEFKECLINNDIYLTLGSQGVKYLLYELESFYRESIKSEKLDLDILKRGTIEHIMPQTLTKEWENKLKDDNLCHAQYLHTLGNLALSNNNSKLSNKGFSQKCSIYKEEPYLLTQRIASFKDWNSSFIKERASCLANKATYIWKSLNVFEIIKQEERYDVYHPPKKFKRIKPDTVSFMGMEQKVKSWSELLYIICLDLYNIDDYIMELFANQEGSFIKDISCKDKNDKIISDNLVLRVSRSSESIFYNIKKIIEYYDQESMISISDKFWFTIKQ